jgi:sulfite exporter TauE/SafE
MSQELTILIITAASIGFFHTLLGPDHYIPFIVMSKAKKWSLRKTTLITGLCGLGHILGSIALGIIGIALGIGITRIEGFESSRGEIAAWLLIAFGLVYFVWGLRRAIKNRPHKHKHIHIDGTVHEHVHTHVKEHAHVHKEKKKIMTPWVLFIIFVLGPCEPLIPLLMYPAAQSSAIGVITVAAVFGLVTIFTMLSIVLISYHGISFFLPSVVLPSFSLDYKTCTKLIYRMKISWGS